MKDFETRKKEYLKDLYDNSELLSNLKENKPGALKMIYSPKDEKELRGAKTVISTFKNMFRLVDAANEDRLKKIPIEENEGLKIFANLVDEYRKNPKEAEKSHKNLSPVEVAKIVFGYISAFMADADETVDFIFEILGIDDDADFDNYGLKEAISKTQGDLNMGDKTIDEITDDELQQQEDFSIEFEKLCNQFIIEPEEKQMKKTL